MCDTKKCSKCGEVKGLGEFHKDKNSKDGAGPWCKTCRNAYAAAYRLAHPEKVSKAKAEWRQANIERVAEVNREWKKANPENIRRARAKRHIKHRERLNKKSREWAAANQNKVRKNQALWRENNPDKVKAKNEATRGRLTPAYVASALRMRVDEAPPELIALKREQLAIKRMARELKKAATKPTGENE